VDLEEVALLVMHLLPNPYYIYVPLLLDRHCIGLQDYRMLTRVNSK
jgi:hypothetical protein